MATHAADAVRRELHAQLTDENARTTYLAALASFLRFETSKLEFDAVARSALGPHIALHNQLILAMLHDAQQGPPPAVEAAAPMDVESAFDGTSALSTLPGAEARSTAASAAHAESEGGAASATSAGGAGGVGRAEADAQDPPDGGGNLAVSAMRPDLTVDPAEEAALNSLHDRLIELARQHGLQAVQPEAVSYMQRAVRAVTNRLLVAALHARAGHSHSPAAPSTSGDAADVQTLSADDLHDAIRLPAPAPWMAPPSQRAGYTLGAFSKFVP